MWIPKASIRWALLAGVMPALVFFSAPLVITYDSAHYLQYLPILRGDAPVETWDVGRGAGFPIWLLVVVTFLGPGPTAALVASSACACVVAAAIYVIVNHALGTSSAQRWVPWVAACTIFDPTSFGYFHTFLTEYLAATFFTVGVAVVAWVYQRADLKPRQRFVVDIAIGLLTVAAYHVKQPYVAASLLPLLVAMSLERNASAILKWGQSLLTSIVLLAASIVVWNAFLPTTGKAGNSKRMTGALVANNLAATCIRGATGVFRDTDSNIDVCRDFAADARDTSQIASFVPAACTDAHLTTTEAIKLCGVSVCEKPFGVMIEIAHGLARLWAIGSPTATTEHFAIAHRVFRIGPAVPAVFPMPDDLRRGVESYSQTGASAGAIVSPLRFVAPASIAIHSTCSVISALLCAVALFRRLLSTVELSAPWRVLAITSTTATGFCLGLSILGTTIDRYAYPVFPLTVVTVALACIIAVRGLGARFGWAQQDEK